jgi:hypothetical protein
MTTSELIEVLAKLPADTIVGVSVYGHSYDSYDNRHSHGPLVVYNRKPGHVMIATDTGNYIRKYPEYDILFVDESREATK